MREKWSLVSDTRALLGPPEEGATIRSGAEGTWSNWEVRHKMCWRAQFGMRMERTSSVLEPHTFMCYWLPMEARRIDSKGQAVPTLQEHLLLGPLAMVSPF